MAGKAPEVRADSRCRTPPCRQLGLDQRIALRWAASVLGLAKCVPVTTIGAGRGDEGLVDIVSASAMSAQFGGRRSAETPSFSTDRMHQRRQPLLVGLEPIDIDAFALQLLADEAAHLLVADAGQQRRAQAEPGGADGNVGRAAADRLGEGGDVLQPRADLLAVKIDRGAADGDDVEA
jgi:hypothetical protein